jgi:baculoviral IAP repeat-containing protein 6
VIAATKAQSGYPENKGSKSDDKSHVYWAKGTGFGTGSTAQSWDVEMAMQKKKAEEENVTCLLHVLSSFINPLISRVVEDPAGPEGESAPQDTEEGWLPPEVLDLLRSSCLFSAIAGYLRNDSGK